MKPILFELSLPGLGNLAFPSYMTMLLLAVGASVWLARRDAQRCGLDPRFVVDLGIACVLAGIVGARVLAVLTDGQLGDFVTLCRGPAGLEAIDAKVKFCVQNADCGFDYLCDPASRDAVLSGARSTMCFPPRDCFAAAKFWNGGLTFYGGLLLAVPVGLWYCRRHKTSFAAVADVMAPAVMLGLVIGRWGCFLNGCCYGSHTESWLGVHFPGAGGTIHATQLYESLGAAGVLLLLSRGIRPRVKRAGDLFAWMVVLYGLLRICLELLRADPRGAIGPLSTSQLIALPMVAAGAAFIARGRWRKNASLPTGSGGGTITP